MDDDKKKYKVLENILTQVNSKYISLSEADKKRNNEILKQLLDLLTNKMKQQDTLFNEMFTRVFFGGSFYDGLRVGQPDEFDLDLLLSLPKILKLDLQVSKIPGFVHLKTNLEDLYKQKDLDERYKGLNKLFSGEFLDNVKVRKWMESLVIKSLNGFRQVNGGFELNIYQGTFYTKIHKAGPAFTLKVTGNAGGKNITLDIDLVPCFEFSQHLWPSYPFRSNPYPYKPNFFIVPKPLKNTAVVENHYWRMSFQEQERLQLDGRQHLKPAIKLLKKMRDSRDLKCIASYYIKTVALWLNERTPADEFKSSLGFAFMSLLKAFYNHIQNERLPYYWNGNNNLLQGISKATLSNLANRLRVIINDIDRHLGDDRTVVAKYILSPLEFKNFENSFGNVAYESLPSNDGLDEEPVQERRCNIL